jgi:luciferase family oxidoreductase group 1
MIPFSVLDLCPISAGSDAGQAFRNSLELARLTESLGYHRFWLAEHHGMPGVGSAATAVIIGHVAAGTSRIRVGAGGIMLPNHAPLVIAEQFGSLEALFPGRIDLGLGRAPGSDPLTSRALRRTLHSDPDEFPQDVLELMAYLAPVAPDQRLIAVPGAGSNVPIWILGSSLFGAQLAAQLGLPFSFAAHFAPQLALEAIRLYRERFKPSSQLAAPYVMLGMSAVVADTDEEARFLATSSQQVFVSLRSGRPIQLPPPIAGYEESLPPDYRAMLQQTLAYSAVGAPPTVTTKVREFIQRTGADELIVMTQTYEHSKRLRSYELLAQVRDELARASF